MYEYESKRINNYFELIEVCRKATSYFIGSFMYEIIIRQAEWKNPNTKNDFVNDFHKSYFAWDEKHSISYTRIQINCAIRIIESDMVEDALQYVINANDKKIGILEAKENAIYTLNLIQEGKLKY